MRFTAVAVAFFAGLAIAAPGADQTVYETEEVTITSCAPTVTDCPGNAGAGVEPTASTTPADVPVAVTTSAAQYSETPVVVIPSSVSTAPAPPAAETTSAASSVIAITTCVPTVIYSTVPVAPTSTPSSSSVVPHRPSGGVPHVPSGTKGVTTGAATPSPSTPAFNGAGALSGSLGFAGAAAVAAFFLA
ncbi:hypothetical protein N7463_004264 [Penicillium fimorum]|uniref:GPI anchored serine-rich protein n=1 Tax=Penicillium fimorum TaxID=1882269 RepID=A0A9X0CA89_9EURO|nr:hypothetical protein N7463_004264 [Penicillium fimorum]